MARSFASRFVDNLGFAYRKIALLITDDESDDASAPTLTAGSAAPSASENTGSLYIRTSTGALYRRVGGAWETVIGAAGTLTADTISELTSAAGVTIDGLLLKDGFVVAVDNQGVKLGTGVDDTISHNGTLTTWTHATGNLLIDNTAATGATLLDLGTDTNATKVAVRNNTGLELLSVSPTSATGGTVVAYGLRAVSATAAAITTTRTLTAADSGGVFSVAKTSAYAITLPTPAQGFYFKFLILDTGANAVTFSDGAAHLFGQIQEAGTVPIAMTGTTLTAAASQSVGDWLCFEGIDATHYLVTGSSIQASKFTIA